MLDSVMLGVDHYKTQPTMNFVFMYHRRQYPVIKENLISDNGGRTLSYRWPPKISKLPENYLWFLLIFMLVDSNQLLSRSSTTIAEPSAVIAPEYEKWKVHIKCRTQKIIRKLLLSTKLCVFEILEKRSVFFREKSYILVIYGLT